MILFSTTTRVLPHVEELLIRRAAAEELALSREVELEKVSRNVQRLEVGLLSRVRRRECLLRKS